MPVINLLATILYLSWVLGIDNGTISYLYNAGVKLKKTVTIGGVSTITDYLGGYQCVNAILEFFPTSEGYVKNTVVSGNNNYNYVFQYKDHVGNNRITYMTDPADGVLKILEEDHYYPFGLKHNGYSATQQMVKIKIGIITLVPVINPGDATYKYMYNGKELQDELGLGLYDYGWRQYDPAIGRFNKIDRFAEKYHNLSTYSYAGNNPALIMDIQGDSLYIANNFKTLKYVQSTAKEDNRQYIQFASGDKMSVGLNFGDLKQERLIKFLKMIVVYLH